jgi:hypothetical protein
MPMSARFARGTEARLPNLALLTPMLHSRAAACRSSRSVQQDTQTGFVVAAKADVRG